MIGIKTLMQNICYFLNRRGILKKCYRCCAILTVGTTVIAVASFCNKDFGGKNNVTASAVQPDGGQEETDGEEEKEESEEEVRAALQIGATQTAAVQTEAARAVAIQAAVVKAAAVQANAAQTAAAQAGTDEPGEEEAVQAGTDEPEQAQLEARAEEMVAQENASEVISVTAEEYEILTRIVEAEAGTEDVKGKMLVANVVLNRVAYDEFPNTIQDVVFQKRGRRYQFSPVRDGRYYEVEVQDSTRIAVDRVLAGEDESMGALFFCERSKSSASNLKWFDSELELLFSYGCHEFFVYAR